jgi:hypothetical protein
MKSIFVTESPAGWTVQTSLSDLPCWFLNAAEAEQSAYGLAQAIATAEGVAQVVVRDGAGQTIASAVVGPDRRPLNSVHKL